ncbi:MAG TPA: hypothetical protein VKU02_00040 [Gemmataceae bacterium]|nr:hypothetical protein [Gemmataceae bacterium]
MPSPDSDGDKDQQTDWALLESVCTRLRVHLEEERQRVREAIREYPRPIPACDVQFNHLLEERAGIGQELERIQEIAETSRRGGDAGSLLAAFLCSRGAVDRDLKEQLKSILANGFPGPEARWAGH